MVASHSVSGESNTFTSNTSRDLNEDGLFSVQNFDTTAIPPPLRLLHEL